MVGLRDIKKMVDIETAKPKKDIKNPSPEDLDFWLWKAELCKELLSFWKSLHDSE